ncbi:hypothetical protein V9T40_012795 [Parthenolecanium corni]|uniref:Amine oxidase domain-containing protein n=1 Tax=Parthenolecanium corni TaxID=536013 RepID=A0AAN9TBJ6_9HEMI
MKDVIIIGAGISGVAAATRLFERGISNILVLEAENRIGGRIHTYKLPDDEDGYIELGAQWIHGEEKNIVYNLASQKDLTQHIGCGIHNMMLVRSSTEVLDFEISTLLMEKFSENLGIGSVNKIFFKFPHQWLPQDLNGICILWDPKHKQEYIDQVIFFAGEATHGHYYSTAHGALETGYREAERILSIRDLQKNESSKANMMSTSLISGAVPSSLPQFVASDKQTSASSMFLPSTFSPEIPQKDKNDASSGQDEDEDTFGAVGSSLFGWVKDTVGTSSNLLSKVAEKAKSSVGSVITTLDPQMTNFISGSNGLELIVASEREIEVSSIREAFQNVFSRVSVRGLEVEDVNFARQIVGFEPATKAAFAKIDRMRSRHSINGPVIAVQSFIVEISDEKWYDLDLILLQDAEKSTNLESYSQMIPIPFTIINVAKDDTVKDYEHKDTGFSVPVSHILGNNLQVHPSEWQETLTGVSRRQRILSAAKVVANLYKHMLL